MHGQQNIIMRCTVSKTSKQQQTYNRNTAYVECKSKSDANWNHLQIVQKIPQQHTGKARNQKNVQKTTKLGTVHLLRKILT